MEDLEISGLTHWDEYPASAYGDCDAASTDERNSGDGPALPPFTGEQK